ncbi:hypothetical protein K439DRAFT_1387516 [Ramaria rubella]|nr:hypothetical protein K439DRAFT_1387516 [Ramaria rubella]
MAAPETTIGGLEIGVLISSVLYGVVTVQACLYSGNKFKDTFLLRGMVALLWLLETTNTAFIWYILHTMTVTLFGKSDVIMSLWPFTIVVLNSAIIGSIVQIFYANRVRILSRDNLTVPIIVWSICLLRCAFSIVVAVRSSQGVGLQNFPERYAWLLAGTFALDVFIDLLNTSMICYHLLRQKSHLKSTQKILDKLLLYTVESGLITSLCAIAILICSLVMPNNLVYLGLYVIFPRLYTTSMLSSLNTRKNLREMNVNSEQVWSTGVFAIATSDVESNAIDPHQATLKSLPARISTPSDCLNYDDRPSLALAPQTHNRTGKYSIG